MTKPFIICIVDDDSVYKFVVSKTIEKNKLAKQVLIFSGSEEALAFMADNAGNSQNLPDIILLDINMPVMDGFEFMDEYIRLKPVVKKNIAVYMVTSSINPRDLRRIKEISELSGYILKPIQSDLLSAIVDALESNADTDR